MRFSNIRVGLLLSVLIAVFLSNCLGNKISKKEEQHYIINTNQVDSSAYYTILPYKQNMDKTMTEVIGFVETPLTPAEPKPVAALSPLTPNEVVPAVLFVFIPYITGKLSPSAIT